MKSKYACLLAVLAFIAPAAFAQTTTSMGGYCDTVSVLDAESRARPSSSWRRRLCEIGAWQFWRFASL
jgi:hypothetical protein